jgi:hypothetical protein
MPKMFKKIGLILVWMLFSVSAFADGNLDITDSKMVADLVELDEIISAISSGVMGCMDTGKEHKPCMCESRELFAQFSDSANKFFMIYPQLHGQDLVNFKDPEGVLINLSLETVKRQAEMELACDE